MTPDDIGHQLAEPGPLGRDLALFRTRTYRFSDDRRLYVLAEHLEEQYLAGRHPRPATMSYVDGCLRAIRAGGAAPETPTELFGVEGIDINAALAARERYSYTSHLDDAVPGRLVVAIVGAPRSGTSHLHNLLARTGRFSYLTTASCWAWPVRNLHHPRRTLFTAIGDAVMNVDNKRTRVIPALVVPGESEDVWARAVPTYRHLGWHRYEIHPSRLDNIDVLRGSVNAHRRYFDSPAFLAKSPFQFLPHPGPHRLVGRHDQVRAHRPRPARHRRVDAPQPFRVCPGRQIAPPRERPDFVRVGHRTRCPVQSTAHCRSRRSPRRRSRHRDGSPRLGWTPYTTDDSERPDRAGRPSS